MANYEPSRKIDGNDAGSNKWEGGRGFHSLGRESREWFTALTSTFSSDSSPSIFFIVSGTFKSMYSKSGA